MRIYIAGAIGEGVTTLSAFDDALQQIGVFNYNLLMLSSVIPPQSELSLVEVVPPGALGGTFGDRLYVVLAAARTATSGEAIGAAIGWYQFNDGRGVFVEHETIASDEATVSECLRRDVSGTLRDLCVRRGIAYDPERAGMKMVTATAGNRPTCVLVLAAYETSPWSV